MERTLDYKPRYDKRSLNYLMQEEKPSIFGFSRTWRYWRMGKVLNQGVEGACVGHGVVGALESSPFNSAIVYPQKAAFGYYELAKHIDQWEGEDYSGTSVLAGAKVAHRSGLISEYRWCTSIDQVINVVLTQSPIVIGVPWLDSMWEPESDGVMDCSGQPIGGHCVFISGFSHNRKFHGRPQKPVFKFRNSWGREWGKGGSGYIYAEDMEKLLKDGEACQFVM